MDKEMEILRVVRVPPAGKMVVQIGKRRFTTIDEIDHPKAKQIILAALGELITFAGGYEELVAGGHVPPLTPSQPLIQETAEQEEDLGEKQAAFIASLEREASIGREESPTESLRTSALSSAPEATGGSIVRQIDTILQKHLAEQPDLRQRIIRMEETPSGGVRINVDGKRYEGVAEIADPMIRMLIKMATKEWEDRANVR